MEQRAQEIIKQQLSMTEAPTYQKLIELGSTGFMDVYLVVTKNVQTMSSFADHNVALELARIDQFRDHKNDFR